MIREFVDGLVRCIEIDWTTFAVTRGCFMVGYFPVELADERAEKRDVVIASGGFCAPEVMRARWESWADWYQLPRLADLHPTFSVPRGPIAAYPPPPSISGPAPLLPPQPARPTMNLLEPETRSISDLIRLRLRRR